MKLPSQIKELLLWFSTDDATVECPSCGADIEISSTKCPNCTLDIIIECRNCGHKPEMNISKCPNCGETEYEAFVIE
jgi:predicted RNA-binding Zn-ribbon protein involved in translation (DUF1610 family)